jgi:hypothetical protein
MSKVVVYLLLLNSRSVVRSCFPSLSSVVTMVHNIADARLAPFNRRAANAMCERALATPILPLEI